MCVVRYFVNRAPGIFTGSLSNKAEFDILGGMSLAVWGHRSYAWRLCKIFTFFFSFRQMHAAVTLTFLYTSVVIISNQLMENASQQCQLSLAIPQWAGVISTSENTAASCQCSGLIEWWAARWCKPDSPVYASIANLTGRDCTLTHP